MRRSIIWAGIIDGRASSCEKYRMKQEFVGCGEYYSTKTRIRSGLYGVLAIPLGRKAAKKESYAANAQQ